jgi:hypothetical protein
MPELLGLSEELLVFSGPACTSNSREKLTRRASLGECEDTGGGRDELSTGGGDPVGDFDPCTAAFLDATHFGGEGDLFVEGV